MVKRGPERAALVHGTKNLSGRRCAYCHGSFFEARSVLPMYSSVFGRGVVEGSVPKVVFIGLIGGAPMLSWYWQVSIVGNVVLGSSKVD